MLNHWTDGHQAMVDWFRAHGYVQTDPPFGNWSIAWSTRIGYDCTALEFWPWTNRQDVPCVEAIVGHHASGMNPRIVIGTCESVAEVELAHDTLHRLNGYWRDRDERREAFRQFLDTAT